MRIVMDYRPALRVRSGVGEYVHRVATSWHDEYPDDRLTLFTSSCKDRPAAGLATAVRVVSDHRLPVRALNFLWHNAEWPPVEWLTGESSDVAFSPHPLLLPASRAAQVVMVHDLDFLSHPERTEREIKSDYPRLAAPHAKRAGCVIVPSPYTAREVHRVLGVAPERIAICPAGCPQWREPVSGAAPDGYILFFGTLEPRKNVGALLSAYAKLIDASPDVPRLVLAGRAGDDARPWLDALTQPPLAGRVEHRGYVGEGDRQALYAGARMLVLPSFEEGFGMTVLEAMSLRVPVVVSNRGALPELVGDAGLLIEPTDDDSIVAALRRLLRESDLARVLAARGAARAASFNWRRTVGDVRRAFDLALDAGTRGRG